ncbi:hypothetical protein C8T65DRAFT_147521 [Cerioporus squamosus]|nr:hypothetical protein C8T65DRAFT_147521 [Cerioporus squamosus]
MARLPAFQDAQGPDERAGRITSSTLKLDGNSTALLGLGTSRRRPVSTSSRWRTGWSRSRRRTRSLKPHTAYRRRHNDSARISTPCALRCARLEAQARAQGSESIPGFHTAARARETAGAGNAPSISQSRRRKETASPALRLVPGTRTRTRTRPRPRPRRARHAWSIPTLTLISVRADTAYALANPVVPSTHARMRRRSRRWLLAGSPRNGGSGVRGIDVAMPSGWLDSFEEVRGSSAVSNALCAAFGSFKFPSAVSARTQNGM